jgi:hypothetical protein
MIKRISTLAATSTIVLGLAAAGAMGTTTAFASGGGPTFWCENAPLEVLKVECMSVPITFEIDVDHALSGTELNVLSDDINSSILLGKDLNQPDILNGALSGNPRCVDMITLELAHALNIDVCRVAIDLAGLDLKNSVCH